LRNRTKPMTFSLKLRGEGNPGIAAGEPFELDTRLRGKDGIYRWFLARYNPLVEEGRARRWYFGAEIESRKQEEERVRQEDVRLEERTRIAQELHDTLLQTFQSASLHLGAVVLCVAQDSPVKNQLDRILEIMRQGIVEGRSAIQGLRSAGSQNSDLVGALSRIRDELKVQPDIDFCVTVTGRQKQLAREIQHEIYRIGREALVNAFCHSGAKRIELELEYSDSELYLRIRDNGRGIDHQMLEKGREGHWGLAGMRERATRIGGVLRVLSPAAGTEVHLSIPTSSIEGLEGLKRKPKMSCRIDRVVSAESLVVLFVSGGITGEHVDMVRGVLEQESGSFAIDLKNVVLVDRGAVKLLALSEAHGTELRNCPRYLREWVARERSETHGRPSEQGLQGREDIEDA
jgi:signal transduction histidine kinase